MSIRTNLTGDGAWHQIGTGPGTPHTAPKNMATLEQLLSDVRDRDGIGRWCLMTARGVSGRCWLICAENTVVFGAQSLSALIALVTGRAAGRARGFLSQPRRRRVGDSNLPVKFTSSGRA
jgi:hypothetical protein